MLYRLLSALILPWILLYFVQRGFRDRRYWKGLGERLGQPPRLLDATVPGGIWLHAVSVGEVLSAVALLEQLRAAWPSTPLFLSVTTVAARQVAEQRLAALVDGVFYAPVDVCWIVRRVLRRLRPSVLVVLETEIWPNLYREAKRFGCGLLILNGRISDRAFPKYRRWRWAFRHVLRWPDRILVQNHQAAGRYLQLGAPPERVQISGNLKYDSQLINHPPPAAIQSFVKRCAPGQIWIAASTMPPAGPTDVDEDDAVISAFRQLAAEFPQLLLILAPRRPERFDAAASKLTSAGIDFRRRSLLQEDDSLALPGVLLLDTIGELASLFPLASVVFIGGSLAQRGGHNLLEPAFAAKPVIVGPHMENFPDIAEEFRVGGAVAVIGSVEDLAPAVATILRDGIRASALGRRAQQLAESKRGAIQRAFEAIDEARRQAVPEPLRPLCARLILRPLSAFWLAGLWIDRARKMRRRQKLERPVLSVGSIAMGGAGKTPLVAYLAENLNRRGLRVAILTRGYRRRSSQRQLLVFPEKSSSTACTGDEAQILLRQGHAALGIGPDRVGLARLLLERWNPHLFLLEDGFQHWRLARDVDIVVIDALNPFAGGLFPLGQLREPPCALRRASCFLITRSSFTPWPALEQKLRKYQPSAPVFYAQTEAVEWVSVSEGRSLPLPALRQEHVAAFCGLGNPQSFWKTLKELGLRPKFACAFPDHHHYRARELQWLRSQALTSGATALLMTEKDFVNLPEEAAHLLKGIHTFWLKTRLRLEAEEKFWEWLVPKLAPCP